MEPYILVVDNNPMNLEFVRYLLTAKGYTVKTASSVNRGLDLLRESTPCLILSDLNLPERNGFDFLKKVKEVSEWKDIPFCLISATSYLQMDVARARKMGASKYLFRPIEPQTLMNEIEPYLEVYSSQSRN